MGNLMTRILEAINWGHRDIRILMVGLDSAGKTTMLYKLKLGDRVSTVPTIGFNVETIQYRNVSFTVWDIGGQSKLRPLWRFYFEHTQGLIFMVDSNDKERMQEAREELHSLMADPELSTVKLLVLANKSDLPNAISTSEVTQALMLPSLRNRTWFIQSCCAVTGEGLYEGLDWLANSLRDSK